MSGRVFPTGFTLIELLAVLLVLSLLIAVGVPALRDLVHATLIHRESTRLLDAVRLARSESVQRNVPVSLCPSSLAEGGEAACGGSYAGGWIVFANHDRDAEFDQQRDELIRVFHGLPPRYTLTNRAGDRDLSTLLTYMPDGSSRRSLTMMICAPAVTGLESRSVILNRVGRPRLARGWGQCPQV
jgi:type IV fimbrial biogenesis protein FimT